MDKKEFWDRYDHLDQEFVKNYDKLEHLFVQQLEDEGLDFFDLSQVHLLGKFESTLPALCALYEKNIQHLFDYDYVLVNLLFAYVHLRDQKNATRIRQILKDIGYDEKRPGVLDGIDTFDPDKYFYKGTHIRAAYDKPLGKFGQFLLSDLDKVEKFITQKWESLLPKKIFINVINGVGPSPFNSQINEMFYKVGQYHQTKFTLDHFSSGVVHEICHFIENTCLTFSIKKDEIGSYKFFDEGYAEWIRAEYLNKKKEYNIYSDNCAYHMLKSNLFELSNLYNEWFSVMFKILNCPVMETATSFTYFLENRYGYEKLNEFWKSIPKYPQAQSWAEYLKIFFGEDLIDLMKDWKEIIINNKGSKESVSEEIITNFEIEQSDNENMVFHYTSKYPLWAGHNIFIYDDKMKLQMIDKVEKFRFLKDGHLTMRTTETGTFTVFVYFYQYCQEFRFTRKG